MLNVLFRFGKLSEPTAVSLLNVLARHNEDLLRRDSSIPLLYRSGVVYRRETEEVWSDAAMTLKAGHEDCDALASWRAGELLARGAAALEAGDSGELEAKRLRLRSIDAEVMMTTRTQPGKPGMYHCIVRYRVGNEWFRDDPSARLGMFNGQVDRRVLTLWERAGVAARAPMEIYR